MQLKPLAPSDMLPLVSIAIPVRNGAKNIADCLDSVLGQTYQNFEIVVVDDGSTDDTERIVSGYVDADKRVHLVRQDNCGTGMARLSAFQASSGSLVAMLDSDDLWLPTNLEKQVNRILSADDSVGVVYSWSLDVDEHGKPTGGFHASNIEGDVFNSLLCRNFIANASSTLIRRKYLDRVVDFCKTSWQGKIVQRCEEWELYLHLAKRCHFVAVPEFLVLYRQSESSMSRSYNLMAEAHELMIQTTKRIYADTASTLCSLSKANYYLHLAHQNLSSSNPREALKWISEASQAHLGVVFMRPDFYSLFVGTMISLLRKSIHISEVSANRERNSSISARNFFDQNRKRISIKLLQQNILHYALLRLWSGEPLGVRTGEFVEVRTGEFVEVRTGESVDVRTGELPSALDDIPTTETAISRSPNPLVSIVICSYDRPDDLRNCLNSVIAQDCSRPVEIIVVDNHPSSGLTPPVVAEFERVKLIVEPRQGSSYARNAGIAASQGEIIAITDDDVQAPNFWLERLLSGFVRPDVMAVSGNTLPLELDYPSQQLFEAYGNGGLGNGFVGWEADSSWFQSLDKIFSVPTWRLGGTANVAFRAAVFSDRNIGLMHEALGTGMPSGGGEDLYLFYRILKAGYAIKYEPDAFVWHKHRRTMSGLRKQLFGYSKAQIAYQITTLLSDGDWRAVASMVPLLHWHAKRIIRAVTGQGGYPLGLIMLEMAGNLVGPVALIRSHIRLRKEGRSRPYIPVAQRTAMRVERNNCFEQQDEVCVEAVPPELAGSYH